MRSLRRSRLGISTIVAEVLMVLIVIMLSSIVFVWVVPAFQSNTNQDNSGAAYAEKFSTVWGNFATFAVSNPEPVANRQIPYTPYTKCTASTPIISSTSSNIYVPPHETCLITTSVGSVYSDYGSNLTVVGGTINGDLFGNSSAAVTLTGSKVTNWTGLDNVQYIYITGSSFNTSGDTSICTDACDSAIYEGGRGVFTFTNNTVDGQIESEVSHISTVIGNTVNGRLEVESTDFGQVTNNHAQMLDLDQNGVLVISGNTLTGGDSYNRGNPTCPPGPGVAICYGQNKWCSSGSNIAIAGSHNEMACVGPIEIDIANTGSIPVNLVAAYMTGIPVRGPLNWTLSSGGPIHGTFPVTIPVGQRVNVTMQWNPPPNLTALPWLGIYFIFVSSHQNFVDGYIYFGHNPALTITTQSRPENRICPPCY